MKKTISMRTNLKMNKGVRMKMKGRMRVKMKGDMIQVSLLRSKKSQSDGVVWCCVACV
jgi:hypothetical protein